MISTRMIFKESIINHLVGRSRQYRVDQGSLTSYSVFIFAIESRNFGLIADKRTVQTALGTLCSNEDVIDCRLSYSAACPRCLFSNLRP